MLDPKISQLAAKMTAAVLVSILPKVTLIEAKFQRYGFSVDALVPGGFSKDVLKHIEERIFQQPEPKMRQMMGSNAYDYLRSLRQVERAKLAKTHGKQLVQLIQIGDFADLCQYPIADAFGGYGLLEFEQKGLSVHIRGVAHATPDETKRYIKTYAQKKQKDHMHCFKSIANQMCFSPKYEALHFALYLKWRAFIHDNGGQIFAGPDKPQGFCGRMIQTASGDGEAGLLDLFNATAFELFCPPEGVVKNFLASFGLEIVEKDRKFYASDAFGTFWCIGSEKMCYASQERLLALMIENNCQELLC